MPDLHGLEITGLLRSNPLTEKAFILVVLDKADKEHMARAYLAGADLAVTKPFDVRGLSLFMR